MNIVDGRDHDRTGPVTGRIESVTCSRGTARPARSAAWRRGAAAIITLAMVAAGALSVWPPLASAATTIVVTTFDDDLDPAATCEPDLCTLRAAVDHADDGDTIVLEAGTYRLEAQIEVTRSMTIRGQGMADTTITPDAGGHRLLDIPAGATGPIVIEDLRLLDGDGTGGDDNGGALRISGKATVTIQSVRFSSNAVPAAAGARGGAVFMTGTSGEISITSAEFFNNSSANGGAIAIRDSSAQVAITNSRFESNSATGLGGPLGGAIFVVNSDGPLVTGTDFVSNTATGGGAISVSGSTMSVSKSRFDGNEAALLGGALHAADGASVTVTNSTFTDQVATAGSIAGASDASSEIALAFVTIRQHAAAFSSSGGASIRMTNSAIEAVSGCADLDEVTGSIADAASDADCGGTQVADLGLVDDVAPPDAWPTAASSLVDAATANCPDTDQRGAARETPCAVGAIDPVGIACPAGSLSRDQPITCALDVALHGPAVAVHAQHNPVVFDDTVPITNGSGDFTFMLSSTDPSDNLVINAGGGAYNASFPVAPVGGGGGGGGGGSGGGGGNEDGGDPGGEAGPSHATGPAAPTAPMRLANTGRDLRAMLAVGLTVLALGAFQLGRVAHASRRARDGT